MRALWVVLLWLAAKPDGGPAPAVQFAPFVPSGWETGPCPPSYGPHTVICAGTDTGPFKVDRHIPTLFVRAPPGDCQKAGEAARREIEAKGFTVSSEATGRCGPSQVPCVERVFSIVGPAVPAVGFDYLLCPEGGNPMVVSYGVSNQVRSAFQQFARTQVRWTPEAPH